MLHPFADSKKDPDLGSRPSVILYSGSRPTVIQRVEMLHILAPDRRLFNEPSIARDREAYPGWSQAGARVEFPRGDSSDETLSEGDDSKGLRTDSLAKSG